MDRKGEFQTWNGQAEMVQWKKIYSIEEILDKERALMDDEAKQFLESHHIRYLVPCRKSKMESPEEDWRAPIIQQPDQLVEFAHVLGLIGATIQDVALEDFPVLMHFSDCWEFEYDNVLIFLTDKGNFEISYSESSSVLLSKDCIPKKSYYHGQDEDMTFLKVLFSCLKGDTIIGISTKSQTYDQADFDFTGSWGIPLGKNLPAYLREFILFLQSGRQLVFGSSFDWGKLSLLDEDGQVVKLPPDALPQREPNVSFYPKYDRNPFLENQRKRKRKS